MEKGRAEEELASKLRQLEVNMAVQVTKNGLLLAERMKDQQQAAAQAEAIKAASEAKVGLVLGPEPEASH